jgi:hypothetical protein
MSPEKSGTVGWCLLGAGVAAWDYLMPETLSGAVDRALESPRGRYLAIGAVAVTAAHLLNILPKQVDPFYLTIERLKQSD